jgi:hypothetical protein
MLITITTTISSLRHLQKDTINAAIPEWDK